MTDEKRAFGIPWARLSAEFVVIVVGVLVALAFDAAAAARDADRRAEEYVRWIRSDLHALMPGLSKAISIEAEVDSAAIELADALDRTPLPPADSLWQMFAQMTWDTTFTPMIPTVDALVQSGDLQLIAAPESRLAILRYRATASAFDEVVEKWTPIVGDAYRSIGGMVCPGFTCGMTWPELADSPQFRSDVFYIGLGARNRMRALVALRAASAHLMDELEGGGS